MSSTLAFCGLGQMGAPMAARLLGHDGEVVVWNRSPERAEPLVKQGARRASSPEEAARGAAGVFTMLATPAAVEEVVFGEGGLASGLAPGATLVEMSTIGPDAVRSLRERLATDVALLDAPVLGSVPQATEGRLKVFAGGDDAVYERWRPVLERFGAPRHVGPLGSGAAMKLVTNSTLGVLMTGLGEALALADALGLGQGEVLDVLEESPIGVTTRSKRTNIESGDWPARFKLSLASKDLKLVNEAAERAGLQLRLLPAAAAWFTAAEADAMGPLDYSAVIDRIRVSSAS